MEVDWSFGIQLERRDALVSDLLTSGPQSDSATGLPKHLRQQASKHGNLGNREV